MLPFVVAKTLETTIGTRYNAKKLSTGDLQVQIETKEQSLALISLRTTDGIAVTTSPQRTLNTIKGVISEDQLLSCTEQELEEGLKEQGVISAKRISMKRDGEMIPTTHIVLCFQLHSLPTTIKAGYVSCHVRAYIPNPRRCYKCQRFGHGSQVCRGQAVCAKCPGKDHFSETCSTNVRYTNCEGSHPAYSRSCPFCKEEKQVLKIKTEQNITYRAGQLEFQRKGTFSEVARRGVAPLRVSVETQTSGPPLHTPQHKEVTEVCSSVTTQQNSQGETAGASEEVSATPSIWDGLSKHPSQNATQSMDVDDNDCSSQKSSSSLPGSTPSKEQRGNKNGGRGSESHDQNSGTPPLMQVLPDSRRACRKANLKEKYETKDKDYATLEDGTLTFVV
ncbi:uncharacterized protein LOC135378634 [Ornithodoros turicata]|uniref:uncharacterized protein LOC135378634 n=1 Tax=Ornithodoros turicata TaxID=34597 RepID=UPI003138A136